MDVADDGRMLREEDVEYFTKNKNVRCYVRDLFPGEQHRFLEQTLRVQKELPEPTVLQMMSMRLHGPRSLARLPVMALESNLKMVYLPRQDLGAGLEHNRPYDSLEVAKKLFDTYKLLRLEGGSVIGGRCSTCRLCFRTGDMVGVLFTEKEVRLFCCYCMEGRLLRNKMVTEAAIADIEDDEMDAEDMKRSEAVIDEIVAKTKLIAAKLMKRRMPR